MKKITTLLFAAIAISACDEPAAPGDLETGTETSYETGETDTEDGETDTGSSIELPLAGDQYGPCLDEDPRCWWHGECTEGPVGVTMCSAEADVCPPVVIGDLTLFAKSDVNFGGRCVVLCAADIDCYPDVGLICGDGFCGWQEGR